MCNFVSAVVIMSGTFSPQAIFMIPTKPPPVLKETEQANWSANFRDFVTKCLVKNPEERPTATALLQHDFVSVQRSPTILMELVTHTMQAREDESSDSDSDVSFMCCTVYCIVILMQHTNWSNCYNVCRDLEWMRSFTLLVTP